MPINPSDRRINRVSQRCIACTRFQQHCPRCLEPRSAKAFNAGALQRFIIGSKPRRALRQYQPFANARYSFTRECRIQKGQILRAAATQNPIRSAQALCRIGGDNLQAPKRNAQRRAHAIIDPHSAGTRGIGGRARQRISLTNKKRAIGHARKFAIGQRLQ